MDSVALSFHLRVQLWTWPIRRKSAGPRHSQASTWSQGMPPVMAKVSDQSTGDLNPKDGIVPGMVSYHLLGHEYSLAFTLSSKI